MVITEVRIKIAEAHADRRDKLLGFASVTFDDLFVVRDMKIISGQRGDFVSMPSRKVTDHCPGCHARNHLAAKFCNHCGRRLAADRAPSREPGRDRLHADVAHPLRTSFRAEINRAVFAAYEAEVAASKRPGYVSRYDDPGEPDDAAYRFAVAESRHP